MTTYDMKIIQKYMVKFDLRISIWIFYNEFHAQLRRSGARAYLHIQQAKKPFSGYKKNLSKENIHSI